LVHSVDTKPLKYTHNVIMLLHVVTVAMQHYSVGAYTAHTCRSSALGRPRAGLSAGHG